MIKHKKNIEENLLILILNDIDNKQVVVLYEIDLFGSKNPKLSQAVVFKEK